MADLGKLRGGTGKKGADPAGSDMSRSTESAGDKSSSLRPIGKGPKNITETKAFKQGMGGFKQMWDNYVNILASDFRRRSRGDQEALILRMCQVVTVGCAIVLSTFFYQFVPLLIRVFAFPVFIVGSWFIASRVVGPIILTQLENKLNKQ
jgi:hypothetical protein